MLSVFMCLQACLLYLLLYAHGASKHLPSQTRHLVKQQNRGKFPLAAMGPQSLCLGMSDTVAQPSSNLSGNVV